MLIIADESVDAPIIAALRAAGHDVRAIAEISPSATDAAVLLQAVSAGAVLITLDRDFGELIFSKGHQPPLAVIYLRANGMSLGEMIAQTLSALSEPFLFGRHVTIDRNHRRTKVLPDIGETNG
jgi:predicted nuclease of predicted toxin-antitoxin system